MNTYTCHSCHTEHSEDNMVAYCAECYSERKIEDDLIVQLAKERAESERIGKELHKANNEVQSLRYLLDKANEQLMRIHEQTGLVKDTELNNCLRPPTSEGNAFTYRQEKEK